MILGSLFGGMGDVLCGGVPLACEEGRPRQGDVMRLSSSPLLGLGPFDGVDTMSF